MRIRAVIFDWAGTIVDHGSLAPVEAFREAFAECGVALSVEEVRRPMGLPKRDHIRALLADPAIAARFVAACGRQPAEADVEALHARFEPLNAELAIRRAEPVPGAVETFAALRAAGIAIGSTTGYGRPIMDRLVPAAATHGLAVDALAAEGDTASGRPSPLLIYRNFLDLAVFPAAATVKVDDTEAGIAEGRSAGCWTVGVALTGNEAGLTVAELAQLPDAARAALRTRASARLLAAGADLVIDSVADLMPALGVFEARLADGLRPGGATQ